MTVVKSDRAVRVLFDAGLTPNGLVENMGRLDLSPHDTPLRAKADGRGARPRGRGRLPPQWAALFEKVIAPTCQALEEFSIDHLVPSHCIGWRATHTIAARFPKASIQNSVGTRFEFTGAASGTAVDA